MGHISCLWLRGCVDVEFKEGEMEHVVEVQVLYDGQREIREAFTVHLKPDEYMVAETQVRGHWIYKYSHWHGVMRFGFTC